MARVFVDPHLFSRRSWFEEVLAELIASANVTFLFSNCEKGLKEIERVRSALEFKKRILQAKRGVQADPEEVEKRAAWLEGQEIFAECKSCDDPHILGALYIHPTKFVFSNDQRMAECRREIQSSVDNKYCDFIVIAREPTYADHRHNIL